MEPLFTAKDLTTGLKSRYQVSAKAKINGLLTINVKALNESQILSKFKRAINKASMLAAADLKAALDDALTSNVWQTPKGTTDIYDTGELLQSGTVTISDEGIRIAYDAPYAALVHYGGYVTPYGNTSTAKVYLPPRPWVNAVLNGGGPVPQFDFSKYYLREIQREFS